MLIWMLWFDVGTIEDTTAVGRWCASSRLWFDVGTIEDTTGVGFLATK